MTAHTRNNSSHVSTQFTRLRGELHADGDTWNDSIDTLLSCIDPSALTLDDASWRVCPKPFTGRAGTRDATQDRFSSYTENLSSVTFQLSLPTNCPSEWFENICSLWVSYDNRWNDEFDIDAGTPYEDADSKFIIGGYFVDPVVTRDPLEAADHISAQLPKVADRLLLVADFDFLYSRNEYSDRLDFSQEPNRLSPTNVPGVGKKTLERLAKHWGAPSTMILTGDESTGGFTSQAYGNNPDTDQLFENIHTTMELYEDAQNRGETRSSLSPKDLVEYPKEPPKSLGQRVPPHTNSA